MLNYRPDIDGLRAIAVLLVLACHAEITFFSGGYVGVDVFFVISGYLITRQILEGLMKEKFSFREFYLRRARRILPALGLMVLVTAGIGSFLVLPQHLDSFSRSIVSVCLFVSNIFFENQAADYFEQTLVATQPLLHTWSLSVEEQYYLIFPVLTYALWSWSGHSANRFETMAKWFLRIGYLSFVLGLLLTNTYPVSAFYGLPSRFWELLVGSYLACLHFRKSASEPQSSAVLSSMGGLLILASGVFYTDRTTFPGFAALAPCLGAGLIIWTGESKQGPLHRLLSSAPFRKVGALSYSLYLWHWPVGIFCKSPVTFYFLGWNPGAPYQFSLTIAIAWLSWKYVEVPVRQLPLHTRPRRRLVASSAGVLAATLALAAFIKVQAGEFSPQELQALFDVKPGYLIWDGPADLGQIRSDGGGRKLGAPNKEPSFILLGDSFATMWVPGVFKQAMRSDVAGLLVAKSGCHPLRKLEKVLPTCADLAEAQIEFVKASPIKDVILAINWRHPNLMGKDDQGRTLESALDATLADLGRAGKNIHVVMTPPGSRLGPYQDAIRSLHERKRPVYDRAPASNLPHRRDLEILVALQRKYAFSSIDPAQKLCEQKGCLVAMAGKPLYVDNVHLSDFGADFAAEIFSQVLDRSSLRRPKLRD